MDWGMGIDRSDSGKFKIGHHPTIGSDTVLTLDPQNNRCGIGTVSPSTKLHVNGGQIRVNEGSSAVAMGEYQSGAVIWLDGANGDFTGGDYFNIRANNSAQLTFGYAGGQSVYLNSDGDVDILNRLGVGGTHNNSYQLYVHGTSYFNSGSTQNPATLYTSQSTGGNYLLFNNASGQLGYVGWGSTGNNDLYIVNQGGSNTGSIRLYAGSSTKVLVSSDGDTDITGRLGVGGNHSNVYKLLVNGSSRFDDSMYFSSVGQITWSASEFKLRGESGKGLSLGAGGSFGHVVINTDGDTDIAQRLGVGGAHSGSYGLYVHGTSYFGNNIYGADADYLAVFGRARVGYIGWSDYAGFAHRDSSSQTNYALLQSSTGATFLNSASGATLYFRQGNANVGGIVSGNWGLGTISPGSYKLYVNGPSYFTASGTSYAGHFKSTQASTPYGIWSEEPSGATAGYPLLYVSNSGGSSAYFRVDSGGSVNIGSSKLKIGGSSGSNGQVLTTDGSGGISWTTVSGSGSGSGTVSSSETTNSDGDLQLAVYSASTTTKKAQDLYYNDSSNDFFIDCEVNIANGVASQTSSQYPLFVDGGIKFEDELNSTTGTIKLQSNGTNKCYVTSTGFGVATSPSHALHVSGDGFFSGRMSIDANASAITGIDTSYGLKVAGYIASYGHTTWSDYRLKDNTTLWNTSEAATLVKDVPVYSYRWNDNCEAKSVQDQDRIGFLAHEVSEKINRNNLVINEKDGEKYQSVNQTDMIPILWAALQDALKRIEELEAKL
jgi:hypothetical protein